MQTSTMAAVIFVFVVAVIALKLKKQGTSPNNASSIEPKLPVTPAEQKMFWRLKEAFPGPEVNINCQMSFGALLKAKTTADRNRFNQFRADFVLTDKAFNVLSIIELDDSSHRGNEEKDQRRQEMLTTAGYKVLRYTSIPSTSVLKEDIPIRKSEDAMLNEAQAKLAQYRASKNHPNHRHDEMS